MSTLVLIILLIVIYFTGLTASVYHWARTNAWMRWRYTEDEDIVCALFWFVYWPIRWFLLLVSVPFTLAEELGKQHRDRGKK